MIIILYGSQQGNSKAIADEIYDRINAENKIILSLNDSLHLFQDVSQLYNKTMIIITSTTGNGDIPINAEKWWRFIKNRKIDNSYLLNTQFYLLALGDSNYNEFCGAGKKIFKRMTGLKSISLHHMITIDDVDDDYEEKIDYLLNLINE